MEGLRVWVPVLVMMTCSWLSYIDRQALAVISPMVLKDTGLTAGGREFFGVHGFVGL